MGNASVEVEHGVTDAKRTDVIQKTVKSIIDRIGKQDHTNQVSPSIYMVHSSLRNLCPRSFNPRLVSIGPLHRDDENVKAFEGQKAASMKSLLRKCKSREKLQEEEIILKACAKKVNDSIGKIRACYDGIKTYSDVEFVEMMVMDACFILEFIHHNLKSDEPISRKMLLAHSVIYDLVLLENQIPFFVLDAIFQCTFLELYPDSTLIEFIHPLLTAVNLFEAKLRIHKISKVAHFDHILGLLHECYLPLCNISFDYERYLPLCNISFDFSSLEINSAVELDRAGVNFNANRDTRSLTGIGVKLQFSFFPWPAVKPTLQMPVLCVGHFTELVLRNLMAYEMCHRGCNYITSYAISMDMLVDTHEDIAKLVKKKVLVNHMGSNEAAADMINNICKEVVRVNFDHYIMWEVLDKYCKGYWPKNMVRLKRTYFSNPWTIVALVAGMVLFFLTVVQTFFTIKPAGGTK